MWSFIYWTQIYTLLHLRIGSIYCIFQPLENNTVISAIMSWTTEAGRGQAIGMLDVAMRVWAVAVAFHVHGSSMYDPITLSGISLDKITEMRCSNLESHHFYVSTMSCACYPPPYC